MLLATHIVYVPDVPASLAFFEKAFGFKQRFLHGSETYGELNTGETILALAVHTLGAMNFPHGALVELCSSVGS